MNHEQERQMAYVDECRATLDEHTLFVIQSRVRSNNLTAATILARTALPERLKQYASAFVMTLRPS